MVLIGEPTPHVEEALTRRHTLWADGIVLLLAGGVFGALLLIGQRFTAPHAEVVEIDLSLWSLPKYTLLSTTRGFAAYFLSLAFTLIYGTIAAHNRRAERLMIPALDVLQAIPVLGFLPGLVLAMIALFPSRELGLELACIVMIFTGQVWNMTFSFHGSLRSIPQGLREAADVQGWTGWQKFRLLELPSAMIGLVWNSMMSMAGGWFFLTVTEAFTLRNRDYRLPGIGSYMNEAIQQGDAVAMVAGIIAMTLMIVLVDQVVWRPVVVWSQRFKVEEAVESEPPRSWVLETIQRSRLYRVFVAWQERTTVRTAMRRSQPCGSGLWRAVLISVIRWLMLSGLAIFAVWGLFALVRLLMLLPLSSSSTHDDWPTVLLALAYKTTGGQASGRLASVCDYLLWYAKNKEKVKYRQLYARKVAEGDVGRYQWLEQSDGTGLRSLTADEIEAPSVIPSDHRLLVHDNITSQGISGDSSGPLNWNGVTFRLPANSHWKTTPVGMERLARANRLMAIGSTLRFKRFLDDFPVSPIDASWQDTAISGFGRKKQYVVETNAKVIERCLLMTSDPGDLVLDPTCGSGTTAFVAEQCGRRWISIDTSRVSIAIARQRLLTAKFDYFELKNEEVGLRGGIQCRSVPHITLKSIAQNPNLDPIFAKHEPILDERLSACNTALSKITQEIRQKLDLKLHDKQRHEGKKAITDADRRRWELPKKGEKWEHWTVPFDTDPDWPKELSAAVTAYRKAWRAKMDEVNACIAANADQEELVDQPEVVKGVVRVSGPFTVEAVQPPELSLGQLAEIESPISGAPESLDTFEVRNAEAYLDHMLKLLQMDGVRFPDNKEQSFSRLERVTGNDGAIHAEGRWVLKGEDDPDADGKANVAVAFGPQYGPVTAKQVENVVRATNRRG